MTVYFSEEKKKINLEQINICYGLSELKNVFSDYSKSTVLEYGCLLKMNIKIINIINA